MLHSSYGAALIWTALVYQQVVLSINAQNNGPGYLGCFIDVNYILPWSGGRSLRGYSTTSGSLSVELCFVYCSSRGYKYAGVESATECYCGNNEDYGRNGRVVDSECSYTCAGTRYQFCGGFWRISIYQISEGVCNNSIGPPLHGSHNVTNPIHVSYQLNSKFFGTRVRFECDSGYVIQGAETIECIERGNIAEWSHTVPTCTAPSLPSTTIRGPMNAIGIAVGVTASLMILLVIAIVVFRKRQKRREESTDGITTGTVNTQTDVTPESAYEIPNRPGAVNPNPPHYYDVITVF
ncbi:uncharacterized protein [Asterias amurensis]|uniref:uncharacterized protein n=1 Tax=Asterias amurensis TaxID=7602 RepID=UPI003AB3B1E6